MQRYLEPRSYLSFSLVFGEEELITNSSVITKVDGNPPKLFQHHKTTSYLFGTNIQHGPCLETHQEIAIIGEREILSYGGFYFNGTIKDYSLRYSYGGKKTTQSVLHAKIFGA
ncbi:hypothetical protein [Brazilian marseillevirus]|uniref:hypothetical protein n=1 Tax=Brazilian marseillevirus TaxID=1813599 RepID=UPI000782EE82|nr:hypothetical protein A3303_gp221 [Brazilian marseillevirus]AMQ10729.1 hypothetical protein [Brazilian marseillevirus]